MRFRRNATAYMMNCIQFFILVLVSSCIAFAQSTNGSILGTISDPSNAAVAGATVTVKSIETGAVKTATTDASGGYNVQNLQVGHYEVTVTAQGFKTLVLPSVQVQVAQQAKIDSQLQVGALSEQVQVNADASPILNSVTSSVGQVIDTKAIAETPLNGRNFWQLTQLTPGVSFIQGGQLIPTGGTSIRASAVNVNVGGLNPAWTGWYLDGANITEFQLGGTLIQPNVDALQEFKVESGNMGAQYGHFPSLINATLKSGTNQFHGTLYEFIRNNALDAKNYFFIPPVGSHERDEPLHRNQFGAALGGPFYHDKSFFFVDLQSTLLTQAENFNNAVPTVAQRSGDFSAISTIIKDPLTGTPFTGNRIPSNRISSQAAYLLPYMPLPNYVAGTTSYAANTNGLKQQLDVGDIRIDQQVFANDHITARYSIADNKQLDPNPYIALGNFPLRSRGQNALFRETHVFNSRWINEAQVSYYRSLINFNSSLQGTNYNDLAGIQGFDQLNTPANFYNFPSIAIANYSNYTGGATGNVPKKNKLRSWQYVDRVSYTRGDQQITFGYENYHNTFTYQLGQNSSGVFTFNNSYSGDNFADFLLGYPASESRSFFRALYGDNGNLQSFYIQDDWHVRPNLTVNIGLRNEINVFLNGIKGQITGYDTSNNKIIVPSGIDLTWPAVAQLYPLFSDRIETTAPLGLPESIRPTAWHNLNPRIGFAYSPNPNWVIRSAYGIFYDFPDDNALNNTETAIPFVAQQTLNNTKPTPTLTFGNFFQGQPIVAANTANAVCAFGTVAKSCSTPDLSSMTPHQQNQYVQEWNLAVQHQFGPKVSLDVAYVGNKTTHEVQGVNVNDPLPGPGTIQTRRPIQQWGNVTLSAFNRTANYNSLQTKLESRFWKGTTFLTSYTFSKCLSDGTFNVTREAANSGINYYGVCSFYLKHNMVISYLYDLPIGRGHAFLGNIPTWSNYILGHWELSGVTTLQSGLPFTPTISSDNANTGVASQRPNVSGHPLNVHTPACWFYISVNAACRAAAPNATSVFSVPAQYTYGNGGIFTMRADHLIQFDFAVLKPLPLGKERSLELRAEFFNLFNRPTFAAPSTNIDSGSGAQVTSTLNTSRLVELSGKIVF